MENKTHKLASRHEIRDILGSVDDSIILEIMETGASASEIMQAREWLDADYYMEDLEEHMDIPAQRVYNILQNDRERFVEY